MKTEPPSCSEASCTSKGKPGLVKDGCSQLDHSLHKLRTKSLISLCFSYAKCKGNKQKSRNSEQQFLSAPYLQSILHTQRTLSLS